MVGTVLDGRYRVLQKLGEGGMGEVFLVENLALARREALKVLLPSLTAAPEFASRFRREARANRRLDHPNIVTFHDFGRLPDGRVFLATEFVDGVALDQMLRSGPLSIAQAASFLRQLAGAIDHAHRMAVVHRDLKPENLAVTRASDGSSQIKILDFGIAKIVAPGYAESQQLTARGEILGTPTYMAPEAITGTAIDDPRSDLYALGCIAFEMLVGLPPFDGENALAVMRAHVRRQPDPPSRWRPDAQVPPGLDEIVLRCLEKDLKRRFQTGAEIVAALDRLTPALGAATPERVEVAQTLTPPFVPRVAARTVEGRTPQRRAALSQLAEALLDRALGGALLVAAATDVREFDERLAATVLAQEEVRARMAALDEVYRRRSARLRLALGELRLELSSSAPPDLRARVREFEQRCEDAVVERDRDLYAFTDRAVELAAEREELQVKVDGAYADLEKAVMQNVEALSDIPSLAVLLATVKDAG